MFRLSMCSVTNSFLRFLGDPFAIVRMDPFKDQRCVKRALLWAGSRKCGKVHQNT